MTAILSTPPRLNRDQAVILARYAGGETAKTIADDTGTDLAVVGRILDEHAGNNRDRARQLVTAYNTHAQSVAAAQGTTTPAVLPGPRRPDGIAGLLDAADATGDPRMKKTADKIRELLAELRADVAGHREHAELLQEQERLQARLAEIKQRLRPSTRRPATGQGPAGSADRTPVDSKTIRAWAAEQGITCSATGRVPQSITDAYHQAHPRPDTSAGNH